MYTSAFISYVKKKRNCFKVKIKKKNPYAAQSLTLDGNASCIAYFATNWIVSHGCN